MIHNPLPLIQLPTRRPCQTIPLQQGQGRPNGSSNLAGEQCTRRVDGVCHVNIVNRSLTPLSLSLCLSLSIPLSLPVPSPQSLRRLSRSQGRV